MAATQDELGVEIQYLNAYNAIVEPDRVIVFPRYLLDRWVRTAGIREVWTYLALRQMLFRARYRGAASALRVSGSQVAQEAAVSERQAWRIVNRTGDKRDPMSWLMRRTESGGRRKVGDATVGISNRYWVMGDTPMTPADQKALRDWLTRHIEDSSIDGVRGVLRKLLNLRKRGDALWAEVLAPDPATAVDEDRPMSVFDIVQDQFDFRASDLTHEVRSSLRDLCLQVYHALIENAKGKVAITHYAFYRWAPLIGQERVLLYADFRDQCWVNRDDPSDVRNEIILPDGYSGLRFRYGVSQDTVTNWFGNALTRSERREAARTLRGTTGSLVDMRRFFTVAAFRGANESNSQQVGLKIVVEALYPPLTPEDEHSVNQGQIRDLAVQDPAPDYGTPQILDDSDGTPQMSDNNPVSSQIPLTALTKQEGGQNRILAVQEEGGKSEKWQTRGGQIRNLADQEGGQIRNLAEVGGGQIRKLAEIDITLYDSLKTHHPLLTTLVQDPKEEEEFVRGLNLLLNLGYTVTPDQIRLYVTLAQECHADATRFGSSGLGWLNHAIRQTTFRANKVNDPLAYVRSLVHDYRAKGGPGRRSNGQSEITVRVATPVAEYQRGEDFSGF